MESKLSAENFCTAFQAYVREKGGRFTPERKALVDAIFAVESHFTLDDLKAELDKQRFRVSLATVYNTLNELLAAHFIVRFSVQEKTFYEVCYLQSRHDHQICLRCGRITEFQSEELDAAIQANKYRRFTLRYYSLLVYGMCSSCKAQLKRLSHMNTNKMR